MKRLFVPLMLCIFALSAFAQQIDERKAIENAQNFLKSSHLVSMRDKSMSPMKLAYVSSKEDKVNYYVFNSTAKEGGFIIVGGDEAATRILGYSNSGVFDYDCLPPNVKWWLSLYDNQISYAIKNNLTAKSSNEKTKKASIPELLYSKWNQDNPYNSQIPSLGAAYDPLYTGCVATAMAQIMYYYEWPKKGMGDPISYKKTWNTGTKSITLTFEADFANTTYDWANMLPEYPYDANPSSTSSKAVGTLLYHAGVSVNMNYGQSGSAASSANVLPALIRNFGYDKGGLNIDRDYYTDEEWENIIYDELKNERPVLYSGSAPGGGHAFVCHGYNADDDLYAFNWGWGGYCDGYFAMTGTDALDPHGSGIGGAGEGQGYTKNQDILIGVQPDKGNDYIINIMAYKDAVLSKNSYTSGKVTSCAISKGSRTTMYMISSPMNASLVTASFDVGVMMRETATGKIYYNKLQTITNLQPRYFYTDYEMRFYPEDVVAYNGEYEVYSVFSPAGKNDWKIIPQKGTEVPIINITGGKDDAKVDVDFTISDLEVQVARTASINHSKAYAGAITYTSSNEAVAKVGTDGTISGVSVGNATITAKAEGNSRFLATQKTFDVKVINTVKDAVSFEISNTSLKVNETANITSSEDYPGTIIYTSSNESVAKVSNDGIVKAIGEGNAVITAVAEGNALFKKTIQMFNITVTKPITLGSGFVLTESPVAGENNYISMDKCGLTVNLCNKSSNTLSKAPIYFEIYDNNYYIGGYGVYWSSLGSGVSVSYTFDLSNLLKNLTKGITYTIKFYQDGNGYIPMNIPSISVTYVDDINVNFEMTDAGYGTLCLPFNASVPNGLEAYECCAYDEDGYAILNKVKNINGRTPYILQGTKGTYTFRGPNTAIDVESVSSGLLVGVLSNKFKLQSNHYVFQNNDGRIAFYHVGNGEHLGTTAKQYSCIMNVPTLIGQTTPTFDRIKITPDSDDEPTLIRGIKESHSNGRTEIYSIGGNRLNTVQRGINIIRNGDKVIKVLKK